MIPIISTDLMTPVLARRGLGRLIEGLWEGDPVAWGITGVVVVVLIAIAVYKKVSGSEE